MNVVVLLGRIVKDIEVRKTQNETSVVSNTLAVKRSYGKDTDFIDSTGSGSTTATFSDTITRKALCVEFRGVGVLYMPSVRFVVQDHGPGGLKKKGGAKVKVEVMATEDYPAGFAFTQFADPS